MDGKTTASICRIFKESCGILTSENDSGLLMRGNPDHPVSRGFICFRGKHLGEVHHSKERLMALVVGQKISACPRS